MEHHVIVESLLAEHRCLVSIAGQIDRQLGELDAEGRTDYAALLDRVSLLRGHFVNAHAPKDHAVLLQLLGDLSAQSSRVLVTSLESDGVEFLAHLGALAAALEGVLCDRLVPRDALMRNGAAATRRLRAQVALEESAILPWARSHLDASAWRELDQIGDAVADRWWGEDCAGIGQTGTGATR